MSAPVKAEGPVVQEFRLFAKVDPTGKKHFHVMKFSSNIDIQKQLESQLFLYREDPRALLRQPTGGTVDAVTEVASRVGSTAYVRGGPIHATTNTSGSFHSKNLAESHEARARAQEELAPFGLTARHSRWQRRRQRFLQAKARYQRAIAASKTLEGHRRRKTTWILEDTDSTNVFIGQFEGGMNSSYALFFFENNNFQMIPADKWYRFQKRNTTPITSTEDAEARLRARDRQMERFSVGMLKMKADDDGENTQMDMDMETGDMEDVVRIKKENEEGRQLKNDNDTGDNISLSRSGKEVNRLLGVDDAEEEEDPYAESLDEPFDRDGDTDDGEESGEQSKGEENGPKKAHMPSSSFPSSQNISEDDTDNLEDEDLDELEAKLNAQAESRAKGKRIAENPLVRSGSHSDIPSLKRIKTAEEPLMRMATSSPLAATASPATTTSRVTTPLDQIRPVGSTGGIVSDDVTETEVRKLLSKGPLRIKDLLNRMSRGDRMNNEKNKSQLKSILKRIADMKPGEGPQGQKDHFVMLKK